MNSATGSKQFCHGIHKTNFFSDIFVVVKSTALFQSPFSNSILKSLFNLVPNAIKFGVVNESTTVNRFVLHTLQRNITHLAVITRKTNIELGILKRGTGKEPNLRTIG